MTHLGERVADLVDGQLAPEATERAHEHLAACRPCREVVELERLTKQRLAALPPVAPGADLMASLLRLGGPEGPLPPRPGHVPGTARPQTVPLAAGPVRGARRPSGPAVPARPAGRLPRRRARRITTAVLGALSVVGVGVVGLAVAAPHAGTVVPPVDSFVVEHAATTNPLPFTDKQSVWSTGGEDGR